MLSHCVFFVQEMFQQGDIEHSLKLEVSPLMDRQKGGISQAQAGFFTIVAEPLFSVSDRRGCCFQGGFGKIRNAHLVEHFPEAWS